MESCPNCGYCPHCKRSDRDYIQPLQPYVPTMPEFGTWYCYTCARMHGAYEVCPRPYITYTTSSTPQV